MHRTRTLVRSPDRTVRVRSAEFGLDLRVRVQILLINLDGGECLCNVRRVFRRNIRGYRTTTKFGRVRVRVPLKAIEIF
jgi:hypothetical protein